MTSLASFRGPQPKTMEGVQLVEAYLEAMVAAGDADLPLSGGAAAAAAAASAVNAAANDASYGWLRASLPANYASDAQQVCLAGPGSAGRRT